mgnify:CR=1 FL=1
MAMAEAALEEKAPEAEVFVVSSDEVQHYVVLISSKAMQEEALDALREFGFAQTSISNTSGTAKENIADAEKELENLAKSKADTEAEIVEAASHRNAIRLCADRAETAINRAEAENRFAGTESVVCFTGWLEAPEEERFAESMEAFDRKGNSALHYAAARLKEEILLVMQKKGANINLKKLGLNIFTYICGE